MPFLINLALIIPEQVYLKASSLNHVTAAVAAV